MKPRRTPRKKPDIPARKKLARPGQPAAAHLDVNQILSAREAFWQNVIREMLTSLAALSSQPAQESEPAPATSAASTQQTPAEANLFDGRLGIVTRAGERIAIAAVYPLFPCGSPTARDLSIAIECSIFQIRTPDGHVFTVPIGEIRTFHALTPELMEKLERVARKRAERRGGQPDDDALPFGFAAFTSLVRGLPDQPPEPPPAHPME